MWNYCERGSFEWRHYSILSTDSKFRTPALQDSIILSASDRVKQHFNEEENISSESYTNALYLLKEDVDNLYQVTDMERFFQYFKKMQFTYLSEHRFLNRRESRS